MCVRYAVEQLIATIINCRTALMMMEENNNNKKMKHEPACVGGEKIKQAKKYTSCTAIFVRCLHGVRQDLRSCMYLRSFIMSILRWMFCIAGFVSPISQL